MPLYLYDDARARSFEPFALTRPVSELCAGALITRQRWALRCAEPVAGAIVAEHLREFTEFEAPPAATGVIPAGSIVANARCIPVIGAAASPEAPGGDVWVCDGRVAAVELGDGRVLGADLLVLACGTRPRAELARAAGLAAGAGIIVDDQMRSVTDPAVFAIGECAEHRGRACGLIAPSWEQARVAARVIAGGAERYEAPPDVVRLKADGIELAVLGPTGGAGAEVVRFTDAARGVYQKLVLRRGSLAGAILAGDTRAAGLLTQLLDRGTALPPDRAALLLGRGGPAPASPAALPGQATVCQCNGVTKDAICAAWQGGARAAGEIAERTRATTGCGTCRDAVAELAAWLAGAGLVTA